MDQAISRLLAFSSQFEHACILHSNNFEDAFGNYKIMAGFGAKKIYKSLEKIDISALKFGFISYDYKNNIENISSNNPALIPVPDVFYFEPEYFYLLDRNGNVYTNIIIENLKDIALEQVACTSNWIEPSKDEYLKHIQEIKNQIGMGDFYELNYCTQWFTQVQNGFNPYVTFEELNRIAPAPFSCFFKYHSQYLLCSSPERFLSLQKNKLVSQPIKGTRRRSANEHLDKVSRNELSTSEKDRAENIMIVDLVRNDFSRVCEPGTVEVEELCAIRSYSHVHQMISTVSGTLKSGINFKDLIHATFPMGSMTGAPKVRVMQEIEKYENFKRGWYSGTVGYILNGSVDLNVVIRSVQYDNTNGNLAYHVGGAITFDSIGQDEFEECLVKAEGMLKVLEKGNRN